MKKNIIADVLVMSGRSLIYDLPEAVRFSSKERCQNIDGSWIMVEYIRSSRLGKGTHIGVDQLCKMIRKVSSNGNQPCYGLKMDIRRFTDEKEIARGLLGLSKWEKRCYSSGSKTTILFGTSISCESACPGSSCQKCVLGQN